MLFYLGTFLFFLYFKIARVHTKEEKRKTAITAQHILVALSAFSLFAYGFTHLSWYIVILVSLLFFILSALIITTIQLGIFVDGKPQLGLSQVYRFLPLLTSAIMLISAILWL